MDILNSETYKVVVTIVRDFSSIISMLSAGFGAVIGLYITNKWQDSRQRNQLIAEDNRKERERTMTLRKEVFIEYLEFVEKQIAHLENYANTQNFSVESLLESYSQLTNVNLRLHLIAREPLLLRSHESSVAFANAAQRLQLPRTAVDAAEARRNELLQKTVRQAHELAELYRCQEEFKQHYLNLITQCENQKNVFQATLKGVVREMRKELGSELSEYYYDKIFAPATNDYSSILSEQTQFLDNLAQNLYSKSPERK